MKLLSILLEFLIVVALFSRGGQTLNSEQEKSWNALKDGILLTSEDDINDDQDDDDIFLDGRLFHSSKVQQVENNVNVLFSPNLFETYTYKLDKMDSIASNSEFKKDRPTVIYIHGWLSNGLLEENALAIRSAFREKNESNFLSIDWSTYSNRINYVSAIKNLKKICIILAEQLEKIRKQDQLNYKSFYLVGHSLGGQCSGLIGRHLKKISNGEFVIPRIYALDPARPGFESKMIFHVNGFDTIAKTDAQYVQIIHTNSGVFGIEKNAGHADFYPNGGRSQPGCGNPICSHQFAWIFFQQSVRENDKFLARNCDNFDSFEKAQCESNPIDSMGFSKNLYFPSGNYFLKTHPNRFASALGLMGIKTKPHKIILEDGSVMNKRNNRFLKILSDNLEKFLL